MPCFGHKIFVTSDDELCRRIVREIESSGFPVEMVVIQCWSPLAGWCPELDLP